MGHNSNAISFSSALLIVAGAACSDAKSGSVDFGDSRPIGRWAQPNRAAPEVEAGTADAEPTGPTEPPDAGMREDSGREPPSTGAGGMGSEGEDASTAAASGKVSFQVTTVVQHQKPDPPAPKDEKSPERYYYDHAYGPLNIGAIWIEDGGGAFVKTLKIWGGEKGLARAHFLHLVGFTVAFGSADPAEPRKEPDVIASATLKEHETHEVTWRLQDRTGKAVPPGEYTLKVEVADYDTKSCQTKPDCEGDCEPPCDEENAVCSVAIDTTAPRGALDVKDTMYCTSMKLSLE